MFARLLARPRLLDLCVQWELFAATAEHNSNNLHQLFATMETGEPLERKRAYWARIAEVIGFSDAQLATVPPHWAEYGRQIQGVWSARKAALAQVRSIVCALNPSGCGCALNPAQWCALNPCLVCAWRLLFGCI